MASFALGSLGFLTPFDFSDFDRTLNDSFEKGVVARLRMRFECTIMRYVENPEEDDSDDRSDMLEMHSQMKREVKHGAKDAVNHHTEEYWKRGQPGERTKADWAREEEWLNKNHRASESFAVLNELVVVWFFLDEGNE